MKRNRVALLVLGFALAAFCVVGAEGSAVAKDTVLKVAGISAPDYRGTQSLYRIKQKVEAGTDGRIKLDIFPANQLGDYTQVFEEIRRGSIEMGLIFLPSQFDIMLELGSLPFLASTSDGLKKQLSPGSSLYGVIDSSLDRLGVKLLRIYGDGFIGVGTAKEPANATDPSADKDTLIRVPPLAVYRDTAQDMGYRTTNIPYADTYSAIQTGVCDGWIGGSSQINYLSFRDVIKYYIPYNCLFDQTAYLMNKKLWETLSEADRKILTDAVNSEADRSFADSISEDLEFQKKLQESGVKIIEISDEDRAALVKHIQETTWPKLAEIYGAETMEKIRDTQ
jgi:TRAP-type C4-dicarboxylate transport system substrate-binding protein